MIQNISIQPHQVKEYARITFDVQGDGFPLLSIDRDSYLTGVQIQSGINFDVRGGRHCIAIGKCCSLAESITFMIDLNHNYSAVCQGELSCLQGMAAIPKFQRKGSIILQNDVWIGHGATIMAGVTLHNGSVVAANSVVTKDVPPYAIVGGNPAKVLRYRFDAETIAGLQKIAWWDWTPQVQYKRRQDFLRSVSEFVEKYLPEAERRVGCVSPCYATGAPRKKSVLLIPDFSDAFPLYPKIFDQYFAEDRPDQELLIYLSEQDSTSEYLKILDSILQRYAERDCDVILQTGETWDEHILFQHVDYFITTRCRETVFRTCLADLHQTKILYGTDEPLFHT